MGYAITFRSQGTVIRTNAAKAAQPWRQDMIIYGTALLAACHLLGIFLGDLLGQALGVKTNVGGVGIAMLLLIFARLYMAKKDILPKLTELGVEYWGAMYIPVV